MPRRASRKGGLVRLDRVRLSPPNHGTSYYSGRSPTAPSESILVWVKGMCGVATKESTIEYSLSTTSLLTQTNSHEKQKRRRRLRQRRRRRARLYRWANTCSSLTHLTHAHVHKYSHRSDAEHRIDLLQRTSTQSKMGIMESIGSEFKTRNFSECS